MGNLIPIRTARSQRLATGSSRRLERAADRGELQRIRQGAYVERDNLAGLSDETLHLARIAAARLAAKREPTFSHESAAALHGIPIVGEWPDRVHTTVPFDRGRSNGAVIRTRRALPTEAIVAMPDGAFATSPARTAIDLAATRSLLGGIVAVSHVRHLGVPLEELETHVAEAGLIAGIRRVRAAIARSTAASESVLETLIWVRCQDFCVEPPEQQREVRGIDGRDYRVDFAWSDGRLLLEGDGKEKYGAIPAGEDRSGADVLWAEKRREDAIRPVCDQLIRADWSDAWGGQGLLRRLRLLGLERGPRCPAALTF